MRWITAAVLAVACLAAAGLTNCFGRVELEGLEAPVRVQTDARGVPHVEASSLVDAMRVQGYLHARDRFFQMDVLRRTADGTLAELFGGLNGVIEDARLRLLGLRGAAEREEAALSDTERPVLEAYVEGVNAWLETNPLPPEYAELELTRAEPWTIVDSFLFAKLFMLLFDNRLFEIGETTDLARFVEAGREHGFDGRALYFEDVARIAPMVPVATVPDGGGEAAFLEGVAPDTGAPQPPVPVPFRMTSADLPPWPTRLAADAGSSWWAVAGSESAAGVPMLAPLNDLTLTVPAPGYEMHLTVEGDPLFGDVNVSGISAPGLAAYFLIGLSDHLAWGATGSYFDVYDLFSDRLVRDDPDCRDGEGQPVRLCLLSEGALHPVEERDETYLANLAGDGIPDNHVDFTLGIRASAPAAAHVLTVPFRSFGPILDVGDPTFLDDTVTGPGETTALTLQWTGFHATRDLRGALAVLQARDVDDFREALRLFAGTASHYVVADSEGQLAYFATREIPLRADLEAGRVEGEGPAFIRDGSGPSNWIGDPDRSQGQTIPFAVLPFEEMPQLVNPPSGFVVNTNNEPTGLEYDNDALNQRRRSNPDAIYYLGFAHRVASHLRAGRATQLIEARLAAGETVSFDDMARFHGDVRQLDAELLVPHLLEAWDRAVRAGAPAALADLATDPRLEEAIGRLAAWDYTAPTGIPEGYDASDVDGENHPDEEVSAEEIASSVAATLYNVWRAQVVEDVIVTRLADFGLANTGLTSFGFRDIFDKRNLKALHHLLSRDPYTGVGASGIDFFPEPVALGADDRRDAALLRALQATLDALASDTYAAAFARSEDQDDYRWGKLSRVTLRHPASPTRSVPPAGGFANLSPQLPGIPRDGAFQTLNRGTPDAAASGANGFEVTIGSVYRWVLAPGHPDAWRDGVLALSSLAGGTSGDADSPHYADRLAKWLTADFDVVPFDPHAIDWFTERTEDFLPPRSDDP